MRAATLPSFPKRALRKCQAQKTSFAELSWLFRSQRPSRPPPPIPSLPAVPPSLALLLSLSMPSSLVSNEDVRPSLPLSKTSLSLSVTLSLQAHLLLRFRFSSSPVFNPFSTHTRPLGPSGSRRRGVSPTSLRERQFERGNRGRRRRRVQADRPTPFRWFVAVTYTPTPAEEEEAQVNEDVDMGEGTSSSSSEKEWPCVVKASDGEIKFSTQVSSSFPSFF